MSCTERTTGVILESRPYQEGHYIVSLFGADRGMVRLFAPRRHRRMPPTALTQVECLYSYKNESSLFRVRELTVRDPLLKLRSTFTSLQLAGTLAQTLLKSQLLWKPAPDLYQLLIAYLNHASTTTNPDGFVSSFLLKLLRHEGLLGLSSTCTHCRQLLETAALTPGETLCPQHAPEWATTFQHRELLAICELTSAATLRAIDAHATPHTLRQKVEVLFDQLVDS